jgi:type VI secretion system FHA domain protein
MGLILEVVSSQRRSLGEKRYMTFGRDGGTIGRSLQSDWPLPDPKRFLSGKHASIDFYSGRYYIVDTSRNGVYVNGAEEPVGRGKPQRLFAGDRVRIGEYEFVVSIDEAEDTREAVASESHIDPVNRRQHVDPPDPPTYDLVDEHKIRGSSFEITLTEEDSSAARTAPKSSTSSAVRAVKPAPAARKPSRAPGTSMRLSVVTEAKPQTRPHSKAAAATATATARDNTTSEIGSPLHAFFRGAGIDDAEFDITQGEQLLFALGQVTREMIVGIIDCLNLRAMQKAQLRQSNTTLQPRDNNPLKFSTNFDEGFSRMLIDASGKYMTPVEAIRDAFFDIKHHQKALIFAVRSAVDQYLERLEPGQIEGRAANGRKGALVNAANRYRYWDLYKDVYAVLANRPAEEFPQPFIDALAEAYTKVTGKDFGETEGASLEAN